MPISSADPQAFVALGMQSGLGSPQTSAPKFRFAKYLSGTNFEPMSEIQHMREGGDGLDFGFAYKKSQKVQGQLVVNFRPEIAAMALAQAVGGATWNGASLPAQHNFHTGHASHPWSTLQIAHPATDLVHFLSNVRFTGLSIEGQSGEPWKLTLPFLAITHGASSTVLVPTYYGDTPLLFHDTPAYLIDGATDSTVESFKIDLSLGIEEIQAQSIFLDEAIVQNRDVNVEIVRRYEANTLWKKLYMGGGVTPTNTVPTGAFQALVQQAAGGSLVSAQFNTNLLAYDALKLTELDPDGKSVKETITAKALKGATHALTVQLKNQHASGYLS